MRKGIHVLGTGDFTHPQWLRELKTYLKEDSHSGLFRSIIPPQELGFPPTSASPLFCLQTEISCIYKRKGKTRRIHNLLFMPDFEAVEKFVQKLEKIGNLNADGRPILGIDSRDLLEIALECSPDANLVPAHIWTPWYALFGSKSGFDDIKDCFGDLTPHIFALETGLSSDPPMNRLCSSLDGYALISNSDAHSGPNLGREANLFSGDPSYKGIFDALKASARREHQTGTQPRFLGTLEFYPEEGKYHLDGHRKCGISLFPHETRELDNRCPVCSRPLTLGVLNRVHTLADRKTQVELENEPETRMLMPLPEVVSQILGPGAGKIKIENKCRQIVAELGPELNILCLLPIKDIRDFLEPLGEAIYRIRRKNITMEPGFDGQYGNLTIFRPGELNK